MDFATLVKQRRSANKFIEGIAITEQDLEPIFNQVKLAPSCFNLQHTEYFVILDPEKKQAFYEGAVNQYKLKTASAAIVVLGNVQAYQDTAKLYEGMRALGMMSQQEFDQTVSTVHGMYEGFGLAFQQEEAVRNASLSAMLFMLAAKDQGWDTCPMIGFDRAKTVEMFNIPAHLVPVMLIAIGKADPGSERPRGYRKPLGEFVTYNSFASEEE